MTLPAGVDDLEVLELLVSVAELGSLSRAAACHGVSQPAASTRLARLEKRLGLQLLTRSTTGCVPTPAGAAFVEWSRELLAHAERMGRAVEALRHTDHDVAVAASLTIAEQLLPTWLAAIHARRPDVRVRVTVANSTNVVHLVQTGVVRVGFIETTDRVRGIRTRTIGADHLVVVVAPGHPWLRRRSPLQPHHLASSPLVLREPGSGTRRTLEGALERCGLSVSEPILELASTAAIRNAVAAGVGPTVISELAVSDDVAAGRLAVVATTGLDLGRPLRAVWRGATPLVLSWLLD